MRCIFTLILTLITSHAFGAASLTPAFSKFSSAGMSVDAGKQGTNTMQVVGATFSKPGGKPTMTIEPISNAPTGTPGDSGFFGFLDGTFKKISWGNMKTALNQWYYRLSNDVRGWGAACDGSTDDTDAIQAALDQGKAALCKGVSIITQLAIPSYAELSGYGIGSSILKQKTGSNKDMVLLQYSSTQMVKLHDLSLDGNKANQSSGNGINLVNSYTASVLNSPSTLSEWDARHQIRNVYIQNVKGTGVIVKGRGETQLSNIEVRLCDKNSFDFSAYDLWASGLSGGMSGEEGLILRSGYDNVKLSNSKMWMSGRIDTSKGDGFSISGSRNTITGCEAQDNAKFGFSVLSDGNIITGAIAEANGWYDGYKMAGSGGFYVSGKNNLLNFTAGDRFGTKQDRAVVINTGTNNIITGVSKNMAVEAISDANLKSSIYPNRILIAEEMTGGTKTVRTSETAIGINQDTYGVTSAYIRSRSSLNHSVGPIVRFDTDTNPATVFRVEKFDAAGTDATKKRWDFQINTTTGNLNVNPLDGAASVSIGAPIIATTVTSTLGGSTNHAVCWKSTGQLGYCSAVIASDGTCGTCN